MVASYIALMKPQDLFKLIVEMNHQNPAYFKFLSKLCVSCSEADPIDRKEAVQIDMIDYFGEVACDFIRHYSLIFVEPESLCALFRLALEMDKQRVRQQAKEERRRNATTRRQV